MAKPQEKQAFMNYSQLEEENDINGYEEDNIWAGGWGCFRLSIFEWGQRRWLLQKEGEHKETWLVKELRKAKEVSELVVGPKWKNFIRKISNCFHKKKSTTQFQYDPRSYALNFDDGIDEEEDGLYLGYSSRFARSLSGEELQVRL